MENRSISNVGPWGSRRGGIARIALNAPGMGVIILHCTTVVNPTLHYTIPYNTHCLLHRAWKLSKVVHKVLI